MRIIDTGITKEILTGDNFPQLKIADKLYTVDNRQSTFDKIKKLQQDTTIDDEEKTDKMYEIALGKESAKEIKEMDLPVDKYGYLSFCVMGAITGEDPDKLKKAAENSKNI